MAEDPLQKLYLDNPIDREVVPDEPLSFELVSDEVEPVPFATVVSKVFGISVGFAVASLISWVFLLPADLASSLPWMPLVTCAASLLLAAWTLLRCSTPEVTDPRIGLILGIGAYATAVLSSDHPRVLSLVQGALLLYTIGEISSHWLLARWRHENPLFADDLDDGGIRHAGAWYQRSLQVAVASGLIVVHIPWLLAPAVLLLTIVIVWGLALRRSISTPVRAIQTGIYLVEQTFGYPDSNELSPGLFRSPMLAKPFRYFPMTLFVAASLLPLNVSLAPMDPQNWFDPDTDLLGHMIAMVGNVVLMVGLLVHLAEEVCDET